MFNKLILEVVCLSNVQREIDLIHRCNLDHPFEASSFYNLKNKIK